MTDVREIDGVNRVGGRVGGVDKNRENGDVMSVTEAGEICRSEGSDGTKSERTRAVNPK